MTKATTPSKRPSRAERRDGLLAVAAHEFAAGGWGETSVDQIARAAGVSAPVLYDHFGSKRGLFIELLERHGDALLARIAEAVAGEHSPEGRFRASINAFFTQVCDDPFACRTLFREPAADQEIAERQRAAQEQTTHLIAEMFIAGGAPKERRGDVILVAHLFKSALSGLASWWWDHPAFDTDHLVDLAHRALWNGIGSFPGTEPNGG